MAEENNGFIGPMPMQGPMPPEGFMTRAQADEIVGELLSIPNELLSVNDAELTALIQSFVPKITNIEKGVSEGIKVEVTGNFVGGMVKGIKDVLVSPFKKITGAITKPIINLKTAIVKRFKDLKTAIVKPFKDLKGTITKPFINLKTGIVKTFKDLKGVITKPFTAVKNLAGKTKNLFGFKTKEQKEEAQRQNPAKAVIDYMNKVIVPLLGGRRVGGGEEKEGMDLSNAAIVAAAAAALAAAGYEATAAQSLYQTLRIESKKAVKRARIFYEKTNKLLGGRLDKITSRVSDFISKTKNTIKDIGKKGIEKVGGVLKNLTDSAKSGLKDVASKPGFLSRATSFIKDKAGAIRDTAIAAKDRVVSGAKSAGSFVKTKAIAVKDTAVKGVKAAGKAIDTAGGAVVKGVKTAGGAVVKGAKAAGGAVVAGAKKVGENVLGPIKKKIASFVSKNAKNIVPAMRRMPLIGPAIESFFAAGDIREIMNDTTMTKAAKEQAVGSRLVEGIGGIVGAGAGGAIGSALIPIPMIGTFLGAVTGDFAGRYIGGLIANALGARTLGRLAAIPFGGIPDNYVAPGQDATTVTAPSGSPSVPGETIVTPTTTPSRSASVSQAQTGNIEQTVATTRVSAGPQVVTQNNINSAPATTVISNPLSSEPDPIERQVIAPTLTM
jgi:hypothetical protein